MDSIGIQDYMQRLSTFMQSWSTAHTQIQQRKVFIPTELLTCSHVFIRIDAVGKPLKQPCEGPFRVISLHKTFFKVDRHGRVDTITIERPKAAYVDDGIVHASSRPDVMPARPMIEAHTSESSSQIAVPVTISNEASASRSNQQCTNTLSDQDETSDSRSGRRIALSARLRD
ncbi:unnamed protein product [Echinostoma caproni]|uniref:Uncharacterized protein n=1 Tax=Echinostoma caproni TaxID=27848 RepID=A0A183BEW7_9TREM|nr:unnamed protein product [Echinostoma caproni]